MKRLVLRTQTDLPHPGWLFGPDRARQSTPIAADLAPIACWLSAILAD